jgi:dTMP kinase
MLITFEGPEGCGKSTHCSRLKSYLESRGYPVIVTREPGGTLVGGEIREMLLHSESAIESLTEAFLFAADRSEHVKKIIQPALAEGKVVIADRFIDSTLAYQAGGRGLPEDLVRYLNMVSSSGLIPDLTFLLDIDPEIGLRRASGKGKADRFEGEGIAFHRRIYEMYHTIARGNPQRIKIIDTEKLDVDATQNKIREFLDEKLRD